MRKPPSPTTAMTALSGFTSLAAIAEGRPAAQHTAASARQGILCRQGWGATMQARGSAIYCLHLWDAPSCASTRPQACKGAKVGSPDDFLTETFTGTIIGF